MAASSSIIVLLVLVVGVASTEPINIAEQFLSTALEAQGTSQSRIINVLSLASGDPQDISQRFNSEIKATILEPNGDVFRVNLGGLKQVLSNTIELHFTKLHQNQSLNCALRYKIDELLEARSGDLEAWIDKNPIPIGLFVEVRRRKRADQNGAIANAVANLVGNIVDPVLNNIGNIAARSSFATAVGRAVTSETQHITSLINTLRSAIAFILTPLNQTVKSLLGELLDKVQCDLGKALLIPIVKLLKKLIATLPCSNKAAKL